MSQITEYIRNIALITVFISFVKIILPTSTYSRYIDLVLSLTLLFVMANPVVSAFSGNGLTFEQQFSEQTNQTVFANSLNNKNLQADSQATNVANEIVSNNAQIIFKSQMEALLKPENYLVSNVFVALNVETGEISQIDVELNHVDKTKTPLINVETVSIRTIETIKLEKSEQDTSEKETKEIKKIKNIISDFYNVDISNIHIILHERIAKENTHD